MTVLAAWCAAIAVLFWLDSLQWGWVAALGMGPAALMSNDRLAWSAVAILSGALYFMARPQQREASERDIRMALARFWQQTAVLISAGLTFWQAVEVSLQAEPLLQVPISQAAQSLTRRARKDPEPTLDLGQDGQLTLLLLQHGYLHGITTNQIQSHVHHLEARLLYEAESKKRRDPIWMTILPAVLLLNVLWLFLAPMVVLAGHSWLKI